MAELTLTAAQRAVVEDRGGSLLVSAAAGSGKTKVLVERLFRYLREEHANVDDFLIITYTKAAAAELRGKIAAELNRRIAEEPEDGHLRRQLLRVYQADIKTVDAFCAGLLRENSHLLAREEDRRSLSPDFRVLDEDEAALLRQRVLERTLDGFYAGIDEAGELLAGTLGFGRDDRKLSNLVLELYGKLQSHAWPLRWLRESRAQWGAYRPEGDFDATPYAAILRGSLGRRAAFWGKLLGDCADAMTGSDALVRGYQDRFYAAAGQLRELAAACGSWEGAGAALAALRFPKLGAVRNGGAEKERAKRLWDACKKEMEGLRPRFAVTAREAMEDLSAVAPAMAALLELVERFSEDYRQEKLRRNAADFSDQEHLALGILLDGEGEPTELARQVASRYREILVDEYQDTNEVQDRIFRAVSREGRNLFTVGDVKQSIYRFRLADPGIFLQKYETYRPAGEAEEGEARKILLSRNFRSRREVLSAANFVFANILSREMGGMEYGEGETLHLGAGYPEREDCAVEYHLLCCGGEEAAPRRDAEADFVARRIRALLAGRFPVTEGDGSLRPCRPEDIVILLRSPGGRGADFAAALARQGIPSAFAESADFFSTMEIATVLSLLELIDNPRQDVPLIAVLRSPLFGFSPSRLAVIRSRAREGDFLDALRADGGEDCQHFLAELEELRLRSRDLGVGQLLWHLYHRLNVLGIFGAMEGGEQRRENLIALTEQAQRWEKGGCASVYAFVGQMRRLLESGRAPKVSVGEERGGVRILSIHKSKGLEFPIVILADLSRAFSQMDYRSSVLVHPKLGLGPERVDLARRIRYPTLAKDAVRELLERENKEEEQRVLYVAMTRPKEKLILVDARAHAERQLQRLAAVAACPALPETVENGKCFGDWILLPLLCRAESAPLRQLAGAEDVPLETGSEFPWEVFVHSGEELTAAEPAGDWREAPETPEAAPDFDPALLEFQYPYQAETLLPAKLTATQMKGREADREIAENAARTPSLRPLTQPRFRRGGGDLTAAEAGTAVHLALQYLDFRDFDVAGQIARMEERHLLPPAQAAAIPVWELERFLRSPLAEELRAAETLLREYRFTVLLPARNLAQDAAEEDRVLLQGIVDCCFGGREGPLTVLDFKTDRVEGEALRARAERYRPQLEAYSDALSRVLERPVGRRILCFLHAGETVEL